MYPKSDRLDLGRVLDSLREKVEASTLPRRDIEKRLGLSRGYLARLLSGDAEIRLWQILGLLDILEDRPAQFFREHFPITGPRLIHAATGRPAAAPRLRVNREIVGVYGLGIASIRELSDRLDLCERTLRILEAREGEAKDEPSAPDQPRARS